MKVAFGILLFIVGLPSAIGGAIFATFVIKELALVIFQDASRGPMRLFYGPAIPILFGGACLLGAAFLIAPALAKAIRGPLK